MIISRVIPSNLRRRSYLTLVVIVAATISESFGLSLIMPLMATILGLEDKGGLFPYIGGLFSMGGIDSTDITPLPIVLTIAFMFFLKFVLSVYRNYLLYGMEWMLRKYWMSSIFEHYAYLDYSSYENEKPGHITNKLINETLKAASGVRQMFFLVSQVLMLVFLSLVLLFSNVQYTLITLSIGGGLVYILKKTIINMGRDFGVQRQKHEAVVFHEVNELVHGMKTIRSFVIEKHFINKFMDNLGSLVKLMRKTEVITRLPLQLTEFIFVLLFAVSFVMLDNVVGINYTEILPYFAMFAMVAIKLFGNLGSLATNVMSIKVLMPAVEIVESYLKKHENVETNQDLVSAQNIKPFKQIEFNKISFAYNAGHEVFKDMSLVIPRNTIVAIIGKTGTGKSTISKLLIGLYTPQKGDIRINGLSLSDIEICSWRKTIGYVEQEPFFFNGSILENLTNGDMSISNKMIQYSLEVSHSQEFIDILPDGLNTIIGDKGSRLSGGQKARLALARAVIINPDVLLLDEVTSALDNETEIQIVDSLKKLKKYMSIVVISHDDEILNIADHIYKIENQTAVRVSSN